MEAHGFWIHPATVRIKFLPPVHTAQLSRDELKDLDTHIRQLIVEEKEKM